MHRTHILLARGVSLPEIAESLGSLAALFPILHPPHIHLFAGPSHSDSGHGHQACFGQWDVSIQHASQSMKTAIALVCVPGPMLYKNVPLFSHWKDLAHLQENRVTPPDSQLSQDM